MVLCSMAAVFSYEQSQNSIHSSYMHSFYGITLLTHDKPQGKLFLFQYCHFWVSGVASCLRLHTCFLKAFRLNVCYKLELQMLWNVIEICFIHQKRK